ncbi:hypothetical protein GJ744_008375 [Endocarpon pusillum]|uniref:Major facilitator superfamily (MFS) profile domain-containing protein n=1 Tax=Endocarpon pusillum TaxID=364733 RepID=A0A8H7AHD0_9EURO|nr:hypothetical protein GJ744_008375 [Endocarpon pusillum]
MNNSTAVCSIHPITDELKATPGGLVSRHDPVTIDFDSPNDPTNPVNWSTAYRWSMVILISVMSLVVNLAILMCAPATPHILQEFHSDDQLKATLLVSIWELGEVFGPLLIGPLSEMYGRLPIYHAANVTFIVFSAIAAESRSINMLIGCRLVLGISVASTVLNPSIVGDMFHAENRGRAMAVMGMTPFIAPVLGPIIGALISEAKGWRWTFWIVTIVTAAFEVIFAITYRESYRVVILQRTARRSQIQTGEHIGQLRNLRSENGFPNTSRIKLLCQSLCRPLKLPFTSLAVLLVSISCAIGLSYMYVIITNLTNIFQQVYGFGEREVGLTYLGLGFGTISSAIFTGLFLDWYLKRKSAYNHAPGPEHRLPPMLFGNLLVPLGVIGFGWTVAARTPWIVPILCTAVTGFGFVSISLSAWSYVVDAFGIYAASATAAVTVVRNIAAAVLPLASPPLLARLGPGWGMTVLGLVALLLSPLPVVILRRSRKSGGEDESSSRGETG